MRYLGTLILLRRHGRQTEVFTWDSAYGRTVSLLHAELDEMICDLRVKS